ncbi:glycosyltransferase [Roseomonas sp. GC11]|uniref:glycosyltransferase n=1 Tax=Roseomonas sp. GC11 TaxID=2950546 RepID=UPI00210B3365|nr:glycosyltransferase [Roseomonas sp. GC11]MCQ4160251.1 glycosyltransferase [Roseomonas sp. GC11]
MGVLAAALGLLLGLATLHRDEALRALPRWLLAALAQGAAAALVAALLRGENPAWLLAQGAAWVLVLALARQVAEARGLRRFHRRWPALEGSLARPQPKVSLHLLSQDAEPAQMRRTLDRLAALDYPAFEVLVVDSSSTPARWEAVAEHCARLGPRFRFFHLGACPQAARGFALRETAVEAQVIGLVSPGTLARPDWLRRSVPFFQARQGLGFLQAAASPAGTGFAARLAHAQDEANWAAPRRAANEQVAAGLRPTLALLRADALRLAGGWDEAAPDQLADMSLRLLRQGWDSAVLEESMGEAPACLPAPATPFALLRRHAGALLNPWSRALTAGQRRHLLQPLVSALADALWAGSALAALAVTLLLLASRDAGAAPLASFAVPGLGLPLVLAGRAALLAPGGLAALAALAKLAEQGPALLGLPARWRAPRAWAGALGMAALLAFPLAPGWAGLLLGFALPPLASLGLGWWGRQTVKRSFSQAAPLSRPRGTPD